jgi:glucokinase
MANHYTGVIENAANLPWAGRLPLAATFRELSGLPVDITNDANAAAIGEMHFGIAKGMKDFVSVTLGTGLGSGFIANGRLIYGHDGSAGELGHVIAVKGGRQCGCGRKGCLEKYVSAGGIAYTANELLQGTDVPSLMRSMIIRKSSDVYTAAEQGDALALQVYRDTGRILGETLADVVALTVPEAFIFSGGVSKSGPMLFDSVREAMEECLLSMWQGKVKLLHSALPDSDAAILGAAGLVWSMEA